MEETGLYILLKSWDCYSWPTGFCVFTGKAVGSVNAGLPKRIAPEGSAFVDGVSGGSVGVTALLAESQPHLWQVKHLWRWPWEHLLFAFLQFVWRKWLKFLQTSGVHKFEPCVGYCEEEHSSTRWLGEQQFQQWHFLLHCWGDLELLLPEEVNRAFEDLHALRFSDYNTVSAHVWKENSIRWANSVACSKVVNSSAFKANNLNAFDTKWGTVKFRILPLFFQSQHFLWFLWSVPLRVSLFAKTSSFMCRCWTFWKYLSWRGNLCLNSGKWKDLTDKTSTNCFLLE